jgi:hypothetical protein
VNASIAGMPEGIVTDVPGVHHVFNQIRVAHD